MVCPVEKTLNKPTIKFSEVKPVILVIASFEQFVSGQTWNSISDEDVVVQELRLVPILQHVVGFGAL